MTLRLPLIAVLLLAAAGCDALRIDGDTTLTGIIVDDASGDPVLGAVVKAGSAADTTDEAGRFELVVFADSTGQEIVIETAASGYVDETVIAEADVNGVVDLGAVGLERLVAGPGPGPGTGGTTGPAESVSLDQRSSESVGVTGAGGIETATLTFVAYDGQGRPVDASNAVDLSFEIAQGPGGGETIDPVMATTDENGAAQVTLTSGTRSGTVQVRATGSVDGEVIRSLPVTITITGGLPDDAHFSVAPVQRNFAGYNRFGLTDGVTAFVGDRYGNPVQTGTAVYFTTDGGIIPGSGVTDPLGTATVNLLSAEPRPSNAFSCPGPTRPEGYGVVTASTSDENEQRIEDTTTILFSGITNIVVNAPAPLVLGRYTFRVEDQFGHPLAPGTEIAVAVEGINVKSSGDTSVTLGDYLCPGPGRTEFSFIISQGEDVGTPVPETVTITVQSPNGNVQATLPGGGASATRPPF